MTYSKCLISKKEFVDIINKLKSADELQKDIQVLMNKAEENISMDFMNAASLMINHEDIVVKLLEKIMNDQCDDICYFIYELNYGKDYKPGCITQDEVNIDFSTADKLYEYLVEQNFKEET